jgi:hypothetical protein
MAKSKFSGATIPYQLRPRKAIERNIFVDLLKKIGAYGKIDFQKYRYVGFGAAYLEDFKHMHIELGIVLMDCIEMGKNAYTRQIFNNPYYFVDSYNVTSTDYINQDFKFDKNQIIWLDYTAPKMLRQQLTDIEMLCAKLSSLDIVKFTFNSKLSSFISSHHVKNGKGHTCNEFEYKTIFHFIKNDETFKKYLPEGIKVPDISNFDSVIRAMALRAVNRGLSLGGKDLKFHHIAAFSYADGQEMTTLTGILCSDSEFSELFDQCKLHDWPFYNNQVSGSEMIVAIEIAVPDMTISERMEIDKKIPAPNIDTIAKELAFYYGENMNEHIHLIKGYHAFYRYLPHFSKVIY